MSTPALILIKYSQTISLLLILFFCLDNILNAQNSPSSNGQAKIEELIEKKLARDQMIVSLIVQKKIDFVPSVEFIEKLERLGSFPRTVAILKKKLKAANNDDLSPSQNKIIKVLLADFYSTTGQNRAIRDTIKQKLEEATGNYSEIQIVTTTEIISAAKGSQYAKKLGEQEHADLVLWGWYTTSGTTAMVSVNFEIITPVPFVDSFQQRKMITKPLADFDNFSFQIEIAEEYSAFILSTLGLIKEQQKDFDSAEKFYTEALSLKKISNDILSSLHLRRGILRVNGNSARGLINNDRGIDDVKLAMSLNSNTYNTNLALGQIYLGKKLYNESEPILKKALALGTTSEQRAQVLFNLALLCDYAERESEKDAYLKKAISEAMASEELYLHYLFPGLVALWDDNYETARATFQEYPDLASKNDKSASMYVLIALTYEAEADDLPDSTDKASIRKSLLMNSITYLKAGVSRDPYNSTWHFFIEETYSELKENTLAIKSISEAIRLSPKNSRYLVRRAELYEENGDFSLAYGDFTKATEIDFRSYFAHESKAAYHERREEYDGALKEWDICFSIDGRQSIYLSKANIYLKKGNEELAVKTALKGIKMDPDSFEVFFGSRDHERDSHPVKLGTLERLIETEKSPYLYLERALIYSDKPDSSKNYIESASYKTVVANLDKAFAVAIDSEDYRAPNHVYYICQKAVRELLEHDTTNGINYSSKCLTYLSNNKGEAEQIAYFYNKRGWFEDYAHQLDMAINDYTMAIKYFEDPYYYHNRAISRERKGDMSEALKDINTAIQKAPSNGHHFMVRSEIYENMKDFENARKDYLQHVLPQNSYANLSFNYLRRTNEFRKGKSLQETLDMLKRLSESEKSPYIQIEQGYAYLDDISFSGNFFGQENYKKAVTNFDSALSMAVSMPKYNDSKHVYQICHTILMDFFNLRDLNNGKPFADSCLVALQKYPQKQNDVYFLTDTYNDLGNLFYIVGNYAKAIDNYSSAIKYFEQGQFRKDYSAIFRCNRADALIKENKLDLALQDVTITIAWNENIGESHYLRATVYREKGLLDSALKDIKLAIDNTLDLKKKEAYNDFLNELVKKIKSTSTPN